MNQAEQLHHTLDLYKFLESLLHKFADISNKIQNLVLILSVITSGSLWLLLGNIAPDATIWLGAILSTIVTGLTIYMYASGINRKRTTAISLHRELSAFLAAIRSSEEGVDDSEFWDKFKSIETRIRTIEHERD